MGQIWHLQIKLTIPIFLQSKNLLLHIMKLNDALQIHVMHILPLLKQSQEILNTGPHRKLSFSEGNARLTRVTQHRISNIQQLYCNMFKKPTKNVSSLYIAQHEKWLWWSTLTVKYYYGRYEYTTCGSTHCYQTWNSHSKKQNISVRFVQLFNITTRHLTYMKHTTSPNQLQEDRRSMTVYWQRTMKKQEILSLQA